MKIKSQFIICIGVFSIILLVIAASVANAEQQVAQLSAQEAISSNIERGASSLNSISVDYFLYQEDLQISKWQTQFSSLSSDLSSLKPSNAQQQILVNNTDHDLQTLNTIFGDLTVYLQSAPRNLSVRIDPAFQIRWSNMALQSQSLASDAAQLSHSLDNQAQQVTETNNLLIVSLVVTFGALLTTIYLMVFRRALKSVTELQKGIETIGSGNLGYVIETKRKDEISELSQSFNKMTSSLKEVTSSKTDLEQAQTSLRASEQRWSTTLASIGDAVIATDLSGKIMFMNAVAEGLTGWKLNEASQKQVKEIFNIVNEQSRLEVEDPVSKVLERGMIVGLANHTVLIKKGKTEVPIDDSGAPIKDKDGKTTGVVLIFRDISERKKAEEALEHSNKKITEIVESIQDNFYSLDRNWNFVYINKQAAALLDAEPKDLIGQNIWKVFPNSVGTVFEENYRAAMEKGETRRFETRGKYADAWLMVNVFPSVDGITALATDISGRKKAEAAIHESEVKFRTVADFTYDWEFWIAPDGHLVYVSPSCKGTTGYSTNEFMADPQLLTKIIHPEDKSMVGSHFDVVSSDESHEFDYRIITLSGEIRWISHACRAVFDDDGKWIGRRSSNRDITERKKDEEKLMASEEKANALIRYAPTGIYEIDYRTPKFKTVNDAMCKILGMTREELLATSPLAVLDNESKARFKERLLKLLAGEKVDETEEFKVIPKDGRTIYAVLDVMFTYKDGKPDGALVVAHDVTERRKMQNKLEEYSKQLESIVEKRTISLKASEEKYRTLFDSIDEGFCIIEIVFDSNYKPLDYRFLEINDSFERQTGMHDAQGKLMRSFAPNHEDYWFEIYGKVALTAEPVRFTNEAKALNRFYDVYAFPVGQGKIRKVGILFNDISQRKNLERQLQDSERLAAIGATAGMVGHDIRNPLQAITGDLYLAKTELDAIPESPERTNASESLLEIEKNVDYINKIVADLQDYAKPLKPHVEEADLKQIIGGLIAKNGLPENVKVTVKVEADARKVVADPTFINRIMFNLVNNAVQAMPKGGKLTIHAFVDKTTREAVISVKDTGVGIPEAVRDKLFTPMFTTKSKGQGFGLVVIKRMTEALGGTVAFESLEGKGTTFTVRLPPPKH
jgi:PAS domain S-box-containing protein